MQYIADTAARSAQVLVEPRRGALDHVALVRRVAHQVALAGVDHELGRHAERLERVPQLVGLRRRTLAVALADHDQRRRGHSLDERDRRALRVRRRIVVHRCTEVRDHPLIDRILSVVALPVGDAGAGIANWQSYYGQNAIDQWMIPYFGASVYDDPAAYAKSAPIAFVKRVTTPTLIVVGG